MQQELGSMEDNDVWDLLDFQMILGQPIANVYSREKRLPEVSLNYLKLDRVLKGS